MGKVSQGEALLYGFSLLGFIFCIGCISGGFFALGIYSFSTGLANPDKSGFYQVIGYSLMASSMAVAMAGQLGLFYKLIADAVARSDEI